MVVSLRAVRPIGKDNQVTGELLSLLDDGPFRVVSQQGLINSSYDSVVKCLRALYAPKGNELEWQRKLQDRMQKPGEQLVEFAGELRVLADRAYPRWSSEHRQEALRNQFINPAEINEGNAAHARRRIEIS